MMTMVATEIKYITSPYLLLEKLAGGSGYKAYNKLTGKAFTIQDGMKDLLAFLKSEKSSEDIQKEFPILDNKELEAVLAFLANKKMCFRSDRVKEELIVLTRIKDTFLGLADELDKEGQNICFVGVPFGGGNHKHSGTRNFPEEIRKYAKNYGLMLRDETIELANFGAIGVFNDADSSRQIFKEKKVKDIGNLFISIHESREYIYQKIEKIASDIFREKHIPFFLGGDHSITYPIVKAATEASDDLYIIHLDAHTDTYSADYDRLNHSGKLHHHGNFASECLKLENVKRIYQIGIRGILNIISRKPDSKQKIFWCEEVKKAIEKQKKLFEIPKGAKVYLTIDIDVLDPKEAPATATPVPMGLSLRELKEFLKNHLEGVNVIGVDLVEVNPELDEKDQTLEGSMMIILSMLEILSNQLYRN